MSLTERAGDKRPIHFFGDRQIVEHVDRSRYRAIV